MSAFAGLCAAAGRTPSADHLPAALASAHQIRRDGLLLATDAFSVGTRFSTTLETGEQVLHVAGDLIGVDAMGSRIPNAEVARKLALALQRGDADVIAALRGHFCGVYVDPGANKLVLFSDRIGARPLYLLRMAAGGTAFATSIALCVEIAHRAGEKLTPNFAGLSERMHLGYALGTKTQWNEIEALESASLVSLQDGITSRKRYWAWPTPAQTPPEASTPAAVQRTADAFIDAARLRLSDENVTPIAYLSGGLDSRTIVSALHRLGRRADTYTFSRKTGMDFAFGKLFAEKIGSNHRAVHVADFNFEGGLPARLRREREEAGSAPSNDVLEVWSGDGGSVGVGYVYLDERLCELAKRGKFGEIARSFVDAKQMAVPEWLFRREMKETVARFVHDTEFEIARYAEHGARAMFHFLLQNDQRRHLESHYETIVDHRVELVLPFFDPTFLETVTRLRIEDCLYHKFYMDFLRALQPVALEVPWQAYRDHVPCPLPVDRALKSQWDHPAQAEVLRADRKHAVEMLTIALSSRHPGAVVRRSAALAVAIVQLSGLADRSAQVDQILAAQHAFAGAYGTKKDGALFVPTG